MTALPVVSELSLPLERDVFLRTLLRHLAGTLQTVVGLEEASGFISVVGQEMGLEMNQGYKAALSVDNLDRAQVADVLVDLKRRIQGDFFVIEQDDEKIVLGNRACPFAEKVIGRPALCMMTSNVFGSITAETLGSNSLSARRFVDEAKITGQLQHPGIPPVHEVALPVPTNFAVSGRPEAGAE